MKWNVFLLFLVCAALPLLVGLARAQTETEAVRTLAEAYCNATDQETRDSIVRQMQAMEGLTPERVAEVLKNRASHI